MSEDEAKEPSGDSNRGVELFIVPYKGQDVYYDEKLNMYRLKKRWPHQNTRPPRFHWSNEQWREFRLQQQQEQQQRLRQQAQRATNVLPVIYQRPSVPPAGMDSNPDDAPSTSDENQMARCSTEEQPSNSSEQSPTGSIEWHIVDEVLANAFDTQSSGSDNEQESDSRKCDHIQESHPNSADCQSPTSFDQLQGHFTELHSLTPDEQMSPTLADEQSSNTYEWQNPDPTEEFSTNTTYYQSPVSGKPQPCHQSPGTEAQCEMIPNTKTECEISSSVEQVLPSSTTAELFNSAEQQLSISNACMSDHVVPSSTKERYSDSDEQQSSSSTAWVSEQVTSCSTKAEYSDIAEQPSSSDACLSEQVQSIFTKEHHSNLAEQQPQSLAASVPEQVLPSSTQAEYSGAVEQQISSSAACKPQQVISSSTNEKYSDPAEQRACSSPDCVPLEVLYGPPQVQYSNPMQHLSSTAAWVLPNTYQYVPYYSSPWHPVTTHHMLSGTAESQPIVYAARQAYPYTDWQFSGWNGQQPYTPVQQQSIPVQYLSIPVQQQSSIPVQQQSSIPVQQQSSIPVQQQSSIPVQQQSSIPVQQQSSIPVQEPISNFSGQQVLWSVPNVQAQMYGQQQTHSSNSTLHTHHCLNGYPHKVTPCCSNHHPPTPAPVPADSSQTPEAPKTVYYTNMPPVNNSVQQQAGSTPAPVYPLQAPVAVAPSAIPPRELLEWWLRQLFTGNESDEAETTESHAPETDKKHSSSVATSQEPSSSFSSQGDELSSQDTVEVGREEIGVNNMSATAVTVRQARPRDQKNLKISCNVNKSEPERTKVAKSDQHQGDKGGECTAAKKSKKKRNKHRKKQQVQNLEPEKSPAESQCKVHQEQTARSGRKKWQRNRAESRASVKQTPTAGCSEGVPAPKRKGRCQRAPKQLPDLQSLSLAVKDNGRSQAGCHGDPAIDLGGPTPQESASRQRRRRRPPPPPPPQPPAPRHADAHVDGPRPWTAARCSRCSSESPPSGLCYRCCCLGASSRPRRGGGESRQSTDRHQSQPRPQAVRGEAAAELRGQNDALSVTASTDGGEASAASPHQQGRRQHKPPTGLHGQGVGDIQVSRAITQERN